MLTARELSRREASRCDLLGTPGCCLALSRPGPPERRAPTPRGVCGSHSAFPSPGLQWANVGQAPEQVGMTFAGVCWMILFDSALYFLCGWYLSSLTPGKYSAL